MYHLLPYNTSDAPYASNVQSDNNHNPNHSLSGGNNVSDNPSKNHVRCNDCNTDQILPDDNINEFSKSTTYTLEPPEDRRF